MALVYHMYGIVQHNSPLVERPFRTEKHFCGLKPRFSPPSRASPAPWHTRPPQAGEGLGREAKIMSVSVSRSMGGCGHLRSHLGVVGRSPSHIPSNRRRN